MKPVESQRVFDERQRLDEIEIGAALLKFTPSRLIRVIRLLRALDDGCSFAGFRRWESQNCGEDAGKDFDCDRCKARDLLKELGVKNNAELKESFETIKKVFEAAR